MEHHVRRPAGALLRLVRELVADSRQPQTRARTMSCGPFLRFADYRTITERVTFRTSCYDRAARTAALSAALQGGMRWVTLFPCCASSVPRCASRSSDASTETRKANCPRCARRHAGRSRLVDTRAHSITIRENEGMSRRAMPAHARSRRTARAHGSAVECFAGRPPHAVCVRSGVRRAANGWAPHAAPRRRREQRTLPNTGRSRQPKALVATGMPSGQRRRPPALSARVPSLSPGQGCDQAGRRHRKG